MAKKSLNDNNKIESKSDGSVSSDVSSSLLEKDIQNKQNYEYILRKKSVRKKATQRTVSLIMTIFVIAALLVCSLVYGVLAFVDFNSFRITIDKNYESYLTLADNYAFNNASSVLSSDGARTMTNITYRWINVQELLHNDGSLSKNNYIATAFYLKNQGDKGVYYSENIMLTNAYKGLEDTIRILLIKQIETYDDQGNPNPLYDDQGNLLWDTEYKCFGKIASDGVSDEYVAGGDEIQPDYVTDPNDPESTDPWMCKSFYDSDSGVVLDEIYYPILPGQTIRYAMVIWIEGTDPDTIDDKIGGKVSYAFQFSLKYDKNNKLVYIDDADATTSD